MRFRLMNPRGVIGRTMLLVSLSTLVGTAGGCGCMIGPKSYAKCCDGAYAEVVVGEERIDVRGSQNEFCDAGVRHLRNEDWERALVQLKQAVQEKPEDDCAHFALGVVYEKTGDNKNALVHYKKANYLSQFPIYSDSFRRLKDQLGE